ncbi:hypothetical protein HPB51_024203 [Rhipicephalus microplus]|uniref:Uncharacterized protein n=1 Tax=Rhipicephalus microplus TaxID=6941 RepID=A0A9J6DY84_RHIMP|nr:hypothetical protein HPB51_024203 [Rhipicephalus microplus]
MGRTQMLLITFNTPRLPRRLSLHYEIVPVYEHRPRTLACLRCHELGHMAFCARRNLYVVTVAAHTGRIASARRRRSAWPVKQGKPQASKPVKQEHWKVSRIRLTTSPRAIVTTRSRASFAIYHCEAAAHRKAT